MTPTLTPPYTGGSGSVSAETARAESAEALALQKTNNLTDVADAGASRANIHIPVLTPAACVAVANVPTLSGLLTFDGYTVAVGDPILLIAQMSNIANGIYIAATGAWTQPTEFASGVVTKARSIDIINGTIYGGSHWLLETNVAITVGTSAQTWMLVGNSGAGIDGGTPTTTVGGVINGGGP